MYSPVTPPAEYSDRWLQDELHKLEQALRLFDIMQLKELNAVPAKPRTGMIALADGTNWNPGAGQGVYCYYAAAWNKLG